MSLLREGFAHTWVLSFQYKIWTLGGGSSSTDVMIDTLSQSSEVRNKVAGSSTSLINFQNINKIKKTIAIKFVVDVFIYRYDENIYVN